MKTRLSVNINKIALIRNSRGSNLPNLKKVALDCEAFGAEGITVHPRPDQRHIRYDDIPVLKNCVQTEFNIEGYPNDDFMELVLINKPHQVTLVPDPPGVLTSDSGWDTIGRQDFLKPIVQRFKGAGIRVSLFLNPEPKLVLPALDCGADRVELYTGNYAGHYEKDKHQAIAPHLKTAEEAERVGLGLNAGHDLNLRNLRFYDASIPNLMEVSIGHALVCDALYYGLENVIPMYLGCLESH